MFSLEHSIPSLFPDFLTFGYMSIALVRISLGVASISLGLSVLKRYSPPTERSWGHGTTFIRMLATLLALTGLLLVIGLFTQPAALFASLSITAVAMVERIKGNLPPHAIVPYLALSAVALALLFLGPGPVALDYPL